MITGPSAFPGEVGQVPPTPRCHAPEAFPQRAGDAGRSAVGCDVSAERGHAFGLGVQKNGEGGEGVLRRWDRKNRPGKPMETYGTIIKSNKI